MNNLSFNKNNFTQNRPATLSKPIIDDPSKLGNRTIEEIKKDMYSINRPKIEEKKPEFHDLQKNNHNKLGPLKAFREWNKK